LERRIGVALSGGGYRAAAWGMGALLYLVDAHLNDSVVSASSVSGGSITNAAIGLRRFDKMRQEEAWDVAARLARRCSGRLPMFLAGLGLHAAAWVALIRGAGLHEAAIVQEALLVAFVLSVSIGPLAGDATFGSPIPWLYCDLLAATTALLAFSIGEGMWWIGAVALIAGVLSLRGVAVGWAIEQTVLRGTKRRPRVANLSTDVEHVLCACDLHGRHHVYFGSDFTYSYGLGVGSRPGLALSAAVQASANLPFAFPPRTMLPGPFKFIGGTYKPGLLALTDGGVYDNMADEWLLGYDKRMLELENRLSDASGPNHETLVAAAARMRNQRPTFLVIANASGAPEPKYAWTTSVPLLGELLSLLRVKNILYENGNSTRRRLLGGEFIRGDLAGIMVHISTDPWDIIRKGRTSKDVAVRSRAEAAARQLEDCGLDPDTTKSSVGAATALYPLRRGKIAHLLQRSYVLACVQGHIWHDLPLVALPPLAWFLQLEEGKAASRPAPPAAAATVPTAPDWLEPGESVPVVVDSVREIDGVSVATATYFVVVSDSPEPTWSLEPDQSSGFALATLGLVGVISGPDSRTPIFGHPDDLDTLFARIESRSGLLVELHDIWLPLHWLGDRETPRRGDVYRVRLASFRDAYQFRAGTLSTRQFFQSEGQGDTRFSQIETDVFREWAEARFDDARQSYPKDAGLALDFAEEAP
jgi:predicted acylesterase/phospholipase RssA